MTETDATDTDPGAERWRVAVGERIESPPTVAGDDVFVRTGGGTLHALDRHTAEPRWTTETDAADGVRPVVDGERVYVTGAGLLRAVDRTTGDERWRFTFDGAVTGTPSIVGSTVYVGTVDRADGSSALYAVDAAAGTERWCLRSDTPTPPTPAVLNGIVYVVGAGDDTAVIALDAKNGSERWRFETADTLRAGGTEIPPRVAAGLVFAWSDDGHLYAIDARDGTEQWRFSGDRTSASPPVVADGVVYVASGETIHAVDVESGRERWYLRVGDVFRSALRVADGTVYGCTDDTAVAVDAATGRGRWRFRMGASAWDTPIYRDGTVWVASGETLHAIDAETGDRRWAFRPDDPIAAEPTLVDGTLYVVSRDGNLSAVAIDPAHRSHELHSSDPNAAFRALDGVDAGTASALRTAGHGTPQDLRAAAGHELAAVPNVGWGTAPRIDAAVGSRADGKPTDSVGSGVDGGGSPESGHRDADTDAPNSDLDPGEIRWTLDTGGRVRSSPVAAGRTVYLGGADLRAVDIVDGTETWRFEHTFETEQFPATPAFADGTVYAGSADGYLHAVDAQDGTDRWRHGIGDFLQHALAVAGGTVYASTDALHAVDAETGEERWRFDPDSRVSGSPAVGDGVVFVGTSSGRLYAVDPGSGSGDVVFDTDDEHGRLAPPVVADGTVFVGSITGTIHAIDPDAAEELWSCYTQGKVTSRPTPVDGTVYVGDEAKRLYAIDAVTGEERWHFDAPDILNAGTYAAPAVDGGTVYVGSGDSLYAVDAETGKKRWRVVTDGDVGTTPAVANRTVAFGSDDGHLYAVAAER